MRVLVTGSSGLIGGEVVTFFSKRGDHVFGLDNNMRRQFFGPSGDTQWNLERLTTLFPQFQQWKVDVRDRNVIFRCVEECRPDLIVHSAAQPSHDLATFRPFDDFHVNANGTLNLLEAVRHFSPEAAFVFVSTNKVYGDAPNEIKLFEFATRWDYADPAYANGIDEKMRIDQTMHSLFGVSKTAADLMVQEYGRYFGMKTCCLRAGCMTGPFQSGVELHGFLSYLVRANLENRIYRIYGYKGKQVRDNIHSIDVARFIAEFAEKPRVGEVYNLGGGRANSCSILEAITAIEELTGNKMLIEYIDQNRKGDHICYISNLSKICSHFPTWHIRISLSQILKEIVEGWRGRMAGEDGSEGTYGNCL